MNNTNKEEFMNMGYSIAETLKVHTGVLEMMLMKMKKQDRKLRMTNFIIFVGGAFSFITIKGLGARVAELEKEKR